MKRQKRKEYRFYAMLAGMFLLIAGAYCLDGDFTSENDQNAADVSATQPEYVPAVKLYAGIFTKLDGEEYAVIKKNKDILVAAANRGYYNETDVYSFLQGPKSWGEGRAWSGEWSNQYLVISGVDCAVWQIYTVHFRIIPVRHGICFYMHGRLPDIRRRKRLGRSAGVI